MRDARTLAYNEDTPHLDDLEGGHFAHVGTFDYTTKMELRMHESEKQQIVPVADIDDMGSVELNLDEHLDVLDIGQADRGNYEDGLDAYSEAVALA